MLNLILDHVLYTQSSFYWLCHSGIFLCHRLQCPGYAIFIRLVPKKLTGECSQIFWAALITVTTQHKSSTDQTSLVIRQTLVLRPAVTLMLRPAVLM